MSRSPIRGQQWHSATKRHILGGWNDTNSTVDGCNAEHVKILQNDLQTKFKQIIDNLKSDAEEAKIQQEDTLSAGIVKLTKATREMTVREFNQKHQCDLLSLLKANDGVVLSSQSDARRKREHHMVASTPAPTSRSGVAPMSISRTVRKGEGLFSANGSPVETHEAGTMVATVTKKRRDDSATFEINVGDGRTINLNDPTGVNNLDSGMKATAASQLKVLQDQMASLMAQLTK